MIGLVLFAIFAICVFIALVIGGWAIGQYNYFNIGIQNIKTQWSNIKTEYQRRFDMLMNLVESVKSFKKHEKSTLKEVIQARNAVKFSGNVLKNIKDMKMLDNFFSKLMVLFEKYPEIKANEQHNKLMDEIRITEDRINIARTDFNDIVREYNISIKMFPSSIIAKMFHFIEQKYYVNEPETDKNLRINLD